MIKPTLGILVGFCIWALNAQGQAVFIVDSIASQGKWEAFEFKLNIPVGQVFLKDSKPGRQHYLQARLPDNRSLPTLTADSSGKTLITDYSWAGPHGTTVNSRIAQTSSGGTVQCYRFSSGTTISDPGQYVWELDPDPSSPISISLNVGYGSSRLDLSDLSITQTRIFSAASDIFVSFSKPNRIKMESMTLSGGMSQIVVRNLEMARAKTIRIENGMGNTRVILGDKVQNATDVYIQVGAGRCFLIANENAPVRIILDGSIFATVDIPENFIRSGENIFVNPRYKSQPDKAVTFYMDIGVGNFSVITVNN